MDPTPAERVMAAALLAALETGLKMKGGDPETAIQAALASINAAGWELAPAHTPASGPQTARLCAKPDFGRARVAKRKPRA